jgi:hypothetical protein
MSHSRKRIVLRLLLPLAFLAPGFASAQDASTTEPVSNPPTTGAPPSSSVPPPRETSEKQAAAAGENKSNSSAPRETTGAKKGPAPTPDPTQAGTAGESPTPTVEDPPASEADDDTESPFTSRFSIGHRSMAGDRQGRQDDHTALRWTFNLLESEEFGVEYGVDYAYSWDSTTTIPGVGTGRYLSQQYGAFVGLFVEPPTDKANVRFSVGRTRTHAVESLRLDGVRTSFEDESLGYYMAASLGFHLDEKKESRFGIDYRKVFAEDYNFGGQAIDGDYEEILVSWTWYH